MKFILNIFILTLISALSINASNLKDMDSELEIAKKQKELYPKGEKIYKAKCKDINLSSFQDINELKNSLNNFCQNLKDTQLDLVALYLWEVKRGDKIKPEIEVSKDDKCPVCGMFVYKYPRWASKVYYKHQDHEHYFAFDGVKDMMKFILNPKRYDFDDFTPTRILVRDYYSQETIDGFSAFYVAGSDVLGPMGNEFIPFKNEEDANTFKLEHKGNKIFKFDEINNAEICRIDGFECE